MEDINSNDTEVLAIYQLDITDTNWIMTSSFIIFTMQTGFGLLESGCVSPKNEVNIMMKNIVDIVLGGFTYWLFGYGLSFGRGPYTNPFVGLGDFCVDPHVGDPLMGPTYAAFLFQLSFATTATTIVSGAMAERCNFKAYCLFSFLNTVVYCIPAGWVWGNHGFLANLGVVDIAGSGPVHLVGGGSALASAYMLGPRLGRYINGEGSLPLGNPINCCMGLFVLWWGWLAFNSGSTYGLRGLRWAYAARAAVTTMIASFGGGALSLIYSLVLSNGAVDIMHLINGVLGSLVAITAGCFLYRGWEAFLIGAVGGILACVSMPWLHVFGIDDPVGATSVHGLCGLWGVLAVGLFAEDPYPLPTTKGRSGLSHGGGWYLFGIQALSSLCLSSWSIIITALLLWFVNILLPIRMKDEEELIGADLVEHAIGHRGVDIEMALDYLIPINNELAKLRLVPLVGENPGHEKYLIENYGKPRTNKSNLYANGFKLNNLHLFDTAKEVGPKNAWSD